MTESSAESTTHFAQVAVDVPLQTTFTYRIPEPLRGVIAKGHLVHVPWRRRSRAGLVMELVSDPGDLAQSAIRDIEDLLDPTPLLSNAMLAMVAFISRYYLAPPGESAWLAVPTPMRRTGERHFTATAQGRDLAAEHGVLEPTNPVERNIVKALHVTIQAGGSVTGSTLVGKVSGLRYLDLELAATRGLFLVEHHLERPKVKAKKIDFIRRAGVLPAGTRFGERQKAVLRTLERHPDDAVSIEVLRALLGSAARPAVKSLEARGLVSIESREVLRDPMMAEPVREPLEAELTADQTAALAAITAPEPAGFAAFLLHGVTGSGKTEVYIRSIQWARAQGRGALVLLPEIALTPQACAVFRGHFGDDIAVLHSGLTAGERFDEWRRLHRGEVGIAIGARSALFAPVRDLGIIVVDEEHDGSFKQGESPRYLARDMALVLGREAGARVILGSATPSLETFQLAHEGRVGYLPMPNRVGGRPMPAVEIIDLTDQAQLPVTKDESEEPERRFLSTRLIAALGDALGRGEQAIVLLNRRGHATFIQCTYCGHALYCPACSVSLTYHKAQRALLCHLCEYRQPLPRNCPACERPDLGLLGLGTERLADQVSDHFPDARIDRLDRDTGSGKELRAVLRRFREHHTDILVGTQMVAKGHDIHNVTVVGVVLADLGLNFPDFRSSERTFQLLAQVAGRAGRGERPGTVIIQTFSPEHPALVCAKTHDYGSFAAHELAARRSLAYPPFGHLVALRLSAVDAGAAERAADVVASALRTVLEPSVAVLGPAVAPLGRVRGRSRFQILAKSSSRGPLRTTVGNALLAITPVLNEHFKTVRLTVDVDPNDLL